MVYWRTDEQTDGLRLNEPACRADKLYLYVYFIGSPRFFVFWWCKLRGKLDMSSSGHTNLKTKGKTFIKRSKISQIIVELLKET